MFVLEEEEEENLFLRCDISCLVSKVTNKTHWCSSQQVVLYSVFCLYQPTLQQSNMSPQSISAYLKKRLERKV